MRGLPRERPPRAAQIPPARKRAVRLRKAIPCLPASVSRSQALLPTHERMHTPCAPVPLETLLNQLHHAPELPLNLGAVAPTGRGLPPRPTPPHPTPPPTPTQALSLRLRAPQAPGRAHVQPHYSPCPLPKRTAADTLQWATCQNTDPLSPRARRSLQHLGRRAARRSAPLKSVESITKHTYTHKLAVDTHASNPAPSNPTRRVARAPDQTHARTRLSLARTHLWRHALICTHESTTHPHPASVAPPAGAGLSTPLPARRPAPSPNCAFAPATTNMGMAPRCGAAPAQPRNAA